MKAHTSTEDKKHGHLLFILLLGSNYLLAMTVTGMSCIIYSEIIQSKTFSLDLCFFVEICMAAGLLNICVHTFIWYLEWLFSVK